MSDEKPPFEETQALGETEKLPTTSPVGQMNIEASNVLPAATQHANPNVGAYKGKLISSDTLQDELGNVQFRDPNTGQVTPTDSSKHVALRDPSDNTVKIYERSTDTTESGVVGAARVLASGLVSGAVTARPGLTAVKEMAPRASEIFSTSKPYYKAFAEEAGKIEIPKETATGIADRIRRSLDKANLIDELAKPVFSAVSILDKGEPLTLDALQNVKRVIGRSFSSPDKNVRDAAAVASKEIGKVISEFSPTAGANLKKADAIHSTAMAVQDLQRKGAVADLRAGRAGYGGNAVNSMRQVLSPIVEKSVKGMTTGFKSDEIAAMREIIEGTNTTNRLRELGQLSPSKGIIQSATAIGSGVGAGLIGAGPAGAVATGLALPAIGMAANKLATVLTGRQIDALRLLVAKRSPEYAKSLAAATKRIENAQADFITNPSPGKFTAFLSASRFLSSTLGKDGIKV